MPVNLWLLLFVCILTCGGVWITCRKFGRHTVLVDRPNHRSSHQKAVSRAGGLAMIVGWVLGVTIITIFGDDIDINDVWALLTFVSLAMVFGLVDDRISLTPKFKFGCQFLLAIALIVSTGPFTSFPIPVIGDVDLGVLAIPVSLFWVLGLMNAYNFMDGINGMAAGVGIVVLLVLALLGLVVGEANLFVTSLVLAAALGGISPGQPCRGADFYGR